MDMIYTATITSQGQITLPAKLRKQLGIEKNTQVTIHIEDNKMVIEQTPDFLSLYGAFHDKARTDLSPDEIMLLEDKAIDEARADRYKK